LDEEEFVVGRTSFAPSVLSFLLASDPRAYALGYVLFAASRLNLALKRFPSVGFIDSCAD
jgi:hypothetical protein